MVNKNPGHDTSVTSVGCDVKNCKFNDHSGSYCTATQINVQSKTALNKGETFCNTFLPKGGF